MLQLSETKTMLERNGKPFFYLADTCWSAFTNITDEEWSYYLYKRKAQGFNTIQINILPQWDASSTDLNYHPFIQQNPYELDDDYFLHARQMCVQAKDAGFELALVVLWCNYVPGTWASNMLPDNVLPFDCLDGYIEKVHNTFSDLEPLYILSGDTDFPTDETIQYYVYTAENLKKLAPNCLYTTHIKGRYSYIPDELYTYMDLCFYQSGHNAKDLSMPYSLSEEMQNKYPGKLIINSEQCYEEMGYSGKMYGRWTRYDVRRAAYVSVLSGAYAGIAYGAAGIYSWHKVGKGFMTALGEGFDQPKSWMDAMSFPGAWDYGYLKTILEFLKIHCLFPRQDLLCNETNDIRIAQSDSDVILIYVPANTKIRLQEAFVGWNAYAIDLDQRFIAHMDYDIQDGKTIIDLHPFAQDAILVLKKH